MIIIVFSVALVLLFHFILWLNTSNNLMIIKWLSFRYCPKCAAYFAKRARRRAGGGGAEERGAHERKEVGDGYDRAGPASSSMIAATIARRTVAQGLPSLKFEVMSDSGNVQIDLDKIGWGVKPDFDGSDELYVRELTDDDGSNGIFRLSLNPEGNQPTKSNRYTTTVWYTEDRYPSALEEDDVTFDVEQRLHPGKPSKLAKSTQRKGQLTDVVSSEKVRNFIIYFIM